jgi:hypothetical protein
VGLGAELAVPARILAVYATIYSSCATKQEEISFNMCPSAPLAKAAEFSSLKYFYDMGMDKNTHYFHFPLPQTKNSLSLNAKKEYQNPKSLPCGRLFGLVIF